MKSKINTITQIFLILAIVLMGYELSRFIYALGNIDFRAREFETWFYLPYMIIGLFWREKNAPFILNGLLSFATSILIYLMPEHIHELNGMDSLISFSILGYIGYTGYYFENNY